MFFFLPNGVYSANCDVEKFNSHVDVAKQYFNEIRTYRNKMKLGYDQVQSDIEYDCLKGIREAIDNLSDTLSYGYCTPVVAEVAAERTCSALLENLKAIAD